MNILPIVLHYQQQAHNFSLQLQELTQRVEQLEQQRARQIHAPKSAATEPTGRIIQIMKRLASKGNTTPSARDIAKSMHLQSKDIKPYLASLARDGIIQSFDGRQAP